LFYQQSNNVCVLIKTLKNHNAMYLAGSFNGQGNNNTATFCLENKTLVEAEKEIIDVLKEKIK